MPYNILDKSKHDRLFGKNDVDNERNLESILVSIIKSNPKISKSSMAKKTGKSVSTIERTLRKCNKIVRIGSPKNGHWEVKE